MRRLAAALLAGLLAPACASRVAMSPDAAERLRRVEELRAAYVRSPAPIVECAPGDPDRQWSGGRGSAYTWYDFSQEITAPLRASTPDDPARATREAFLGRWAERPGGTPASGEPEAVASADARELAGRFGDAPVLVFEITRFVLLGCWVYYRPWFNVRATLVDPRDGTPLWRDTCERRYPGDWLHGRAMPAEMLARREALYAEMTEARAQECAAELFDSFERTR
jgi:hypothetical protein